jgi:hypothetical protein
MKEPDTIYPYHYLVKSLFDGLAEGQYKGIHRLFVRLGREMALEKNVEGTPRRAPGCYSVPVKDVVSPGESVYWAFYDAEGTPSA